MIFSAGSYILIKVGDVVMVLGKQDKRIRDKNTDGPVYGTVDQILSDGQVCVLMGDGEIWVGLLREVVKQ
jgi:hypothetical protein